MTLRSHCRRKDSLFDLSVLVHLPARIVDRCTSQSFRNGIIARVVLSTGDSEGNAESLARR